MYQWLHRVDYIWTKKNCFIVLKLPKSCIIERNTRHKVPLTFAGANDAWLFQRDVEEDVFLVLFSVNDLHFDKRSGKTDTQTRYFNCINLLGYFKHVGLKTETFLCNSKSNFIGVTVPVNINTTRKLYRTKCIVVFIQKSILLWKTMISVFTRINPIELSQIFVKHLWVLSRLT